MKDSAIVNTNFMKAVDRLPAEKQGAAYKAYMMYATAGEEYSGDDITIAALLEAFRSYIDENREKYDAKRARAKHATEKRSEQNRNNIETISNQNCNDIVCVSVSDSVLKEKDSKESKKKSSAFRRPTLDEVREYCSEIHSNIDPQRFLDYYDSNGWMVGRTHMKDWKASVRSWGNKDREKKPPASTGIQHGTDYDAIIRQRSAASVIAMARAGGG